MKIKVESFARDLVSYHVPSDLRNFENVKHLAGTFPGGWNSTVINYKKEKKKERVVIIFEARKEEDEKEEEEEDYCIWSKATHPAA